MFYFISARIVISSASSAAHSAVSHVVPTYKAANVLCGRPPASAKRDPQTAFCAASYTKIRHGSKISVPNRFYSSSNGINAALCQIFIYAVFVRRAPFEEILRHLLEYGVRKNVFFFLVIAHFDDFFLHFFVFRFQKIRGAASDAFRIAEHFFRNFFVDGKRQFTVFSGKQILRFFCHHLIAFARNHVHHSLRAYDLRRRRNKRRIAAIFTYVGHFGKTFEQFVLFARFLQLIDQIGEHTARHLIDQRVHVDSFHFVGVRSKYPYRTAYLSV